MALVADLLGRKNVDGPAPARTIAEVEDALARLRSEREQARKRLAETLAERERLLLEDGSDKAIATADRTADGARLTLERCEKLEPILVSELGDLRSAAKREAWRKLRQRHDAIGEALVGLFRKALEKRAELMALNSEMRSAGFEAEVPSAYAPPPIGFTPEALAHYEASFERVREMGRPLTPATAARQFSPAEAAAAAERARGVREGRTPSGLGRPAAAPRPSPAKITAAAPATPAPVPEIKPDADGNVRVRVLRTGLRFADGTPAHAGQVHVVPLETAKAWLRSAAADLTGPEEGAA